MLRTLSLDDLSAIMGCSTRSMRRKLPTLVRECGFPRALPGFQRWSESAVAAWLESSGRGPVPANDDMIESTRKRLMARPN